MQSVAKSSTSNGLTPRSDSSRSNRANPGSVGGAAGGGGGGGGEDSLLSRPDVSQMMSFKPSASAGVGMNCVPGGTIPLPLAVINLLAAIPPPDCFHVSHKGFCLWITLRYIVLCYISIPFQY